jgi:homoserine dehydrogenase
MYYGRGAGRGPTASTVIGDIGDIARNIASGAPRYERAVPVYGENIMKLRAAGDINASFYLRFSVADRAGSFGQLATILGRHGVSISTANQKDASGAFATVVVLTHVANSSAVDAALAEIAATGIVDGEPVKLRIL